MHRIINGVNYVDLGKVWNQCAKVSHEEKIRVFLESVGCDFYDEEHTIIRTPRVQICGFGGIPIELEPPSALEHTMDGYVTWMGRPVKPQEILHQFERMRGFAGCMTNMNPGNKTPEEMAKVLDNHGHYSAYRTTTVDLLFSGYPAAIEPNFQRIYREVHHIGVITFTRTGSQKMPPQVAFSEEGYRRIQSQRVLLEESRKEEVPNYDSKEQRLDWLEEYNSALPKNTAMAIMVSVDIKNLRNILKDIHDPGQEYAWRILWKECQQQLITLWPTILSL